MMDGTHIANAPVIGFAVGGADACETAIQAICQLPWETASRTEIMQVAKAYYYFSVQFRENLEVACRLYPNDRMLQALHEGECNTDNLSPWPGVAEMNERLDHDEFIRRLLLIEEIDHADYLSRIGQNYLSQVHGLDASIRAAAIACYEGGGLSRVFQAMLRAPDWGGAGPRAFKFFLERHIAFDADDGGGHGALTRHLCAGNQILPLWTAFGELMRAAVPRWAGCGARNLAIR